MREYYGKPLGLHCKLVGGPREAHRSSMAFHGNPMGTSWEFHGNPMGQHYKLTEGPWESHMGDPWESHHGHTTSSPGGITVIPSSLWKHHESIDGSPYAVEELCAFSWKCHMEAPRKRHMIGVPMEDSVAMEVPWTFRGEAPWKHRGHIIKSPCGNTTMLPWHSHGPFTGL